MDSDMYCDDTNEAPCIIGSNPGTYPRQTKIDVKAVFPPYKERQTIVSLRRLTPMTPLCTRLSTTRYSSTMT